MDELAGKTGINAEDLKATVSEYNGFCDHGYDEIFIKPKRYLRAAQEGTLLCDSCSIRPATAAWAESRSITRPRCIDKNWNVIPGLYASGTDACDIYGDTYVFQLPGNTMGFAMTTGRMAAEHAAEYIKSLGNC